MTQSYGKDLAYIHDVGFGGFARDAGPGLLDILRCHGITQGRIIDLGCGSGIWAAELARRGYDVLGIDRSAAMLDLARRRVPQGTFRRKSFWTARLPSCAAVTSIGECLNYRFDKSAHSGDLPCLFRCVYDALELGGVFVFDLLEPKRAEMEDGRTDHWEGRDWAVLLRVEGDRSERTLIRRMTVFRKVGRSYRRSEEVHTLRLYPRSEVAAALRRVRFRVRCRCGYGQLRLKTGLVAFIARKPGH